MKLKLGLVQAAPVLFDLDASLQLVKNWMQQGAEAGCKLLLFPESFIPGYPRGFDFGAKVGSRNQDGRVHFQHYYENSLQIDSDPFREIVEWARVFDIFLILGATERVADNASLYCSMFYICPDRGHIATHRKIKPTGTERLIWAEAGAASLVAVDSPWGKLGGLICWENYMPLARMSMYQQGVCIYLAPTADARPTWVASMQHIACEGRCFVLACNQFVRKDDYPENYRNIVANQTDILCRGGSVMVSPLGEIIAGPVWDKEKLLVTTIDLDDVVKSRLDFDVVGHYSRPDLFEFRVKNN